MGTATPAAGPALPCLEILLSSLEMLGSGLLFFDRDNPADPFIACEWCDVLPGGSYFGVRGKNIS
jgi:hypothetical protein